MKARGIVVLALVSWLGGCAQPGLNGLSPLDPPWPGHVSLHPELRWEPLEVHSLGPQCEIQDVRYDVRVYHERSILYSVEGLTEPRHRIEMDLQRGVEYRWTVRARFRLNGAPRRSDWVQEEGINGRDARIVPVGDRFVPLKIARPQ